MTRPTASAEHLPRHVVLWIVDDPEAWARAIEVDADAEPGRWPKNRRYIGEDRRTQRYEDAAQIRAAGPRRDWYCVRHDAGTAAEIVADLRRAHPNPGVRYEIASVTSAGVCPDCRQPRLEADGQWRHDIGGYETGCAPKPEPEPEPERAPDQFEINAGLGSMTCGYCNRTEAWPAAVLGYSTLTGFHLLGIETATNTLVVLAEATTLAGVTVHLPHHCGAIPDDVHREYAPTANLRRPQMVR